MKQDAREKIAGLLAACKDMTIATVRADGAPQATVVSYVHDGLLIYFGCGADSQKAQNIAGDPRVSITVTLPYSDWLHIRGLSIAGTATEVTSSGERSAAAKLMMARFPEAAGLEQPGPPAIRLFKVRPLLVSILDYTQGFGHTDLVAVGADDIAESRGSLKHRWGPRALA